MNSVSNFHRVFRCWSRRLQKLFNIFPSNPASQKNGCFVLMKIVSVHLDLFLRNIHLPILLLAPCDSVVDWVWRLFDCGCSLFWFQFSTFQISSEFSSVLLSLPTEKYVNHIFWVGIAQKDWFFSHVLWNWYRFWNGLVDQNCSVRFTDFFPWVHNQIHNQKFPNFWAFGRWSTGYGTSLICRIRLLEVDRQSSWIQV